jgi:hypothetical protein
VTGFCQRAALAAVMALSASGLSHAERINQEGRILGPAPLVTNAILFDTSEADAVVSALQIFPVTNPFNEDISGLPRLGNSDAIMAQVISDLPSNRRTLRLFQEMNFVLTPDSQPLLQIDFTDYPDESDLHGGSFPYGLYPIPSNLPIEGWPTQTDSETLAEAQTDAAQLGGDRHAIMVQPGAGRSFETWHTLLAGGNWQAANGAIFDLNTNALRPDGWTSGDAAGLPMFPALIRFDECERSMVEHACRIVVKRSLYNSYIYPATHYASTNTLPNLPSMGQRLRLKAGFAIPANWTREEKAVLLGLKKYGGFVADNGGFFSISITPDDRWPDGAFDDIATVGLTNFEVVQSTGPNEGPRSPGAPAVSAGPDQTVSLSQIIALAGSVTSSNSAPLVQWKMYSGPGVATFAHAFQPNTTATFSAPGIYTLELSAADGVHAVAYDAVIINVTDPISLNAAAFGANVQLTWLGGSPPFIVDQTPASASGWTPAVTTSVRILVVPATNAAAFFRVRN